MTPHERIRRDQSLVLRDSLLGSSFSYLTIAVAVLLAASLRAVPAVIAPIAPPWNIDERLINKILEIPDGAPVTSSVVPPTQVDGALVAVEDEALRAETAVPPAVIGESSVGPLDASGVRNGPGGNSEGEVRSGADATALPDPEEWIFRDEEPVMVTRVTPIYPELARQARLEGRLVVLAFVGPDGRVRRAEIESGSSVFDESATAAVARWVFTPALADGHPVGVWIRVPVVFRLD